ncbi:hypothetical protein CTI12_AA056210 [Artemisia annua]|uniref:Uncharacterized protein n=1 Tax=Artemisia annua TaxID=35608 RepID=A0A2U1Q9V7_ARTAN|nr:hypothetical protein CTI12_AA056210 [Artemisia annua]
MTCVNQAFRSGFIRKLFYKYAIFISTANRPLQFCYRKIDQTRKRNMMNQQDQASLDSQAATGQSQLHKDAATNQNAGVVQQTGDSVKTMAHGAADVAGGAASGVMGLAQGAVTGAANVAEGAAGAVKNTLGSGK